MQIFAEETMTLIQQDYIIVADALKIEVNLLLFVSISIVYNFFLRSCPFVHVLYIEVHFLLKVWIL